MTELSPAAQAVINSAVEAGGGYGHATPVLHARLAAAIRTAAAAVVPYDDLKGSDPDAWTRDDIRRELLAIADELETF